jgi:hypothetical protein
MKKIILIGLAIFSVRIVSGQGTTPAARSSPSPTVSNTTPATTADVEALRQQVQSLTDTVKALQEQVKDQQAALEKANLTAESGLPPNPEPSPISGAEESPAPSGTAAQQFPTEFGRFISGFRPITRAGRSRCAYVRSFPHHRHIGCNIDTGNNLKHRCRGIVNAADHYRRRQSLHEHLTRQCLCASLFQRRQSQ